MMTEKTGYPSIDKPWLKYYSEEAINAPLPECTMYDYLWQNNKDHLGDIALNYYDRKISYGEMFRGIEEAAKAYWAIGVRRGDAVIVCSVNMPETVYTLYGLNRLGAVVNLVDPRTNEESLRGYINECNAKVVLTVDLAYPIIRKAVKGSTAETVLVVSPGNSLPGVKKLLYGLKNKAPQLESGAMFWNAFTAQGRGVQPEFVNYQKDAPAVMAHTGGTTGMPKAVVLSNDNMNAVGHCYYHISVPLERGHKFFNDLPPFIIYGLSFALHTTLCRGLQVIIYPIFDSKNFPKLFTKYKPNHFCALPDHLKFLQADDKVQKMDLSFLITAGVGGDSLDEKLEEQTNAFFEAHGCKFEVEKGYGMTELSATAISSSPGSNAIGSVGIPLIINTMKIVNPNTCEELTYNQTGEIWISGPSIMLGYYKMPQETDEIIVTDEDGKRWIRTGDLGCINEDGLLFHQGRIRRIYLTAVDGQPAKIFPMLVENAIKESDNVLDCTVVGRPMEGSAYYEAVAYVIPQNTDTPREQMIAEFTALCKEKVPTYMHPTEYRFLTELPHTPIGKVDFRALEEQAKEK